MEAYYNENDPFAAAWLRQLIAAGLIAGGEVDERDIRDVLPNELDRYTQCHFFAGIGVWSYALRLAGWPDDRAVWTGSCPCQPFSAAGRGEGFTDERHLWPSFFHLIEQRTPAVVFGEQVASKDGLAWLDLVQSDLEAAGYAFGKDDLCAAGIGAPHIRQRLYFVALDDAKHERNGGKATDQGCEESSSCRSGQNQGSRGLLAINTNAIRIMGHAGREGSQERERDIGVSGNAGAPNTREASVGTSIHISELANADGRNAGSERQQLRGQQRCEPQDDLPLWSGDRGIGHNGGPELERPGPTNGFWRDADWLFCRDGKWRAVEPGTFPLAHGATARVGRLRGYGNAIVAPVAKEVIASFLDVEAMLKAGPLAI